MSIDREHPAYADFYRWAQNRDDVAIDEAWELFKRGWELGERQALTANAQCDGLDYLHVFEMARQSNEAVDSRCTLPRGHAGPCSRGSKGDN